MGRGGGQKGGGGCGIALKEVWRSIKGGCGVALKEVWHSIKGGVA